MRCLTLVNWDELDALTILIPVSAIIEAVSSDFSMETNNWASGRDNNN